MKTCREHAENYQRGKLASVLGYDLYVIQQTAEPSEIPLEVVNAL